jgi:hypothetical protein
MRPMSAQPTDALIKMAIIGARQVLKVIEREGSFPPMLVSRTGADYDTKAVLARDSNEASRLLRAQALALPREAEACVLLYDAVMNVGGQRQDAILVEGHERGAAQGFLFAQRYSGGGPGRPLTVVDEGVMVIQAAPAILQTAPRVDTYVQIPSGTVIDTLVTVVDNYEVSYFALHEGRVVGIRSHVAAPHQVAVLTRVDAADEWTPELTQRLVAEVAQVRAHLDAEDSGLATCLVAVTRDHLGDPPDVQRLQPLLAALQAVSRRPGGTGVSVLAKPSKGDDSYESQALALIRGLEP